MREILFRGRRVDNGEWETGSLVYARRGTSEEQASIADKMTAYHTPVIPETVGQYTGLTDKNGNKIFEGDICEAYICRADTVEKEVIGTICFEDGTFEFKCEHDNVYIYPLLEVLEVIGNIYDNPEFLKGSIENE